MLLKYYHIAKTLIDNFECFKMYYIPRESNTRVDLLSKLASTKKIEHLKTIIQMTFQTPTIDTEEVIAEEEDYRNFLIQGILPSNENEAQCLKWKASYYIILNGELFKRRLTTPLLKFLNSQPVDYVMRELHKGICGPHVGEPSLETKIMHVDYYWPTLKEDTLDFTKGCKG